MRFICVAFVDTHPVLWDVCLAVIYLASAGCQSNGCEYLIIPSVEITWCKSCIIQHAAKQHQALSQWKTTQSCCRGTSHSSGQRSPANHSNAALLGSIVMSHKLLTDCLEHLCRHWLSPDEAFTAVYPLTASFGAHSEPKTFRWCKSLIRSFPSIILAPSGFTEVSPLNLNMDCFWTVGGNQDTWKKKNPRTQELWSRACCEVTARVANPPTAKDFLQSYQHVPQGEM